MELRGLFVGKLKMLEAKWIMLLFFFVFFSVIESDSPDAIGDLLYAPVSGIKKTHQDSVWILFRLLQDFVIDNTGLVRTKGNHANLSPCRRSGGCGRGAGSGLSFCSAFLLALYFW
jgi:hypothetical protein